MYLKKLAIINFKNHAQREFDLCDDINVFVGDNGTPNQVAQTPFTKSTAK